MITATPQIAASQDKIRERTELVQNYCDIYGPKQTQGPLVAGARRLENVIMHASTCNEQSGHSTQQIKTRRKKHRHRHTQELHVQWSW